MRGNIAIENTSSLSFGSILGISYSLPTRACFPVTRPAPLGVILQILSVSRAEDA
jgi:hypothetical protein